MIENRLDQQYRTKNADLESRIDAQLKQNEATKAKVKETEARTAEINR